MNTMYNRSCGRSANCDYGRHERCLSFFEEQKKDKKKEANETLPTRVSKNHQTTQEVTRERERERERERKEKKEKLTNDYQLMNDKVITRRVDEEREYRRAMDG